MHRFLSVFGWCLIGILGAFAYGVVAIQRHEPLSAAWILTAAVCTYCIGYRFYSKWIAARIMVIDDHRATPAEIHEDGRDFVRTNRWIVLGHHFAAISGPGPLVGPVLAAQFGYLPGAIWIPVGVVVAGAVQDFVILVASMRRDGRSLGEMVKDEIGSAAGILSLVAIVSILVILISVLGLVVVKALAHSPWGTFTILSTMPIALSMGVYLRFLRPGRVLEISALGVVLLLTSVYLGRYFHEVPTLARIMTFDGETLAYAIIVYGLLASALPVWLLLAPRDYLSTFMKLGTIAALAIGILVVMPKMALPAVTRFIDGTGPVFSGSVFPFLFVTIACGAISGFHSLIASGTTPKLITRESHARPIGYGSMLLESAVAIMALIAAGTLEPGIYFAINSPAAIVGSNPTAAVDTITAWGFPVTSEAMASLAKDLGESSMFGRAGGAPTLAVGMAEIFSRAFGGRSLLSLWYHFAIMFEALFILTTIDAGTRVGRFLLQAFLKHWHAPLGDTSAWGSNIISSVLLVAAWGYFLLQGVLDPLGGINTLWPLFGIANQLLSVIALCLATTILLKMGHRWLTLLTLLPLTWVSAVTFTASYEKLFSPNPRIGFLSAARGLSTKLAAGHVPATALDDLRRTIFNLYVDAAVAGFFLCLVGAVVCVSIVRWRCILEGKQPLALSETTPIWLSDAQLFEPEQRGGTRALHGALLLLLGFIPGSGLRSASVADRASKAIDCQSNDEEANRLSRGKYWADEQARRFERPRCC